MLILGQKKEPQRIVLRAAVPPVKAVRKAGKIVTPASEGEPEAFVIMAPITTAMLRRASRVVGQAFGQIGDVAEIAIDELFDRSDLASRELIRLGLVEWGGLGDASGEPLAVTPDLATRFATAAAEDRPSGSIDLLLDDEALVEAITAAYVRPDAQRRAEKNASSASPNGIGEAATRAKDTVSSAAAPARTGRRAKRAAAKNARTASTRSTAKRAKVPGKR